MPDPYRELILRDPASTHRYWNQRLTPKEVAVFFADAKTGASLHPDGSPAAAREPGSCYVFPSIDIAKSYCTELVKNHPTVRCEGYDSRGKGASAILVVMCQRNERAVRRAVFWKIFLAILLIAASVPLFLWDYRQGGLLVIPTLFGINFNLVALRLFWWAYGERRNLKARLRS